SAGTSLTLDAFRNISINASIAHSGTASGGLSLIYGDTGGNGSSNSAFGSYAIASTASVTLLANDTLTIGGTSFTLITSASQFSDLSSAGSYALASAITGWGSSVVSSFSGVF